MRFAIFILLILLSACASNSPAPVLDRQAPPISNQNVEAGYVVKRGDTIYSIARQQNINVRELMAWNQLSETTQLSIGQVLRIKAPNLTAQASGNATANPVIATNVIDAKPLAPPTGANVASNTGGAQHAPAAATGGALKTQPKALKLPYTEQNLVLIQRAETVPATIAQPPVKAAEAPAASVADTPKLENATVDISAVVSQDGVEWSWPATGKVTGKFGDEANKGVEIAGQSGDPIYAGAAGKVTYSGAGVRGYGNLVIIKHNDKYLSAYAHNRTLLVKQGQSVKRGQKIAEMGATGTDTPKLHFEIRRLSVPVDPAQYLPQRTN